MFTARTALMGALVAVLLLTIGTARANVINELEVGYNGFWDVDGSGGPQPVGRRTLLNRGVSQIVGEFVQFGVLAPDERSFELLLTGTVEFVSSLGRRLTYRFTDIDEFNGSQVTEVFPREAEDVFGLQDVQIEILGAEIDLFYDTPTANDFLGPLTNVHFRVDTLNSWVFNGVPDQLPSQFFISYGVAQAAVPAPAPTALFAMGLLMLAGRRVAKRGAVAEPRA